MSSEPEPSPTLFSDHNDPELDSARQVDRLGVVALLLGVVSLAALLGPAYWTIAGIALLGCALILVRLSKRNEPVSGWYLAVAGLVICLAVVTSAPTNHLLRNWRISQQAGAIGKQWLDVILNDKAYMALAAMEDPENRIVNEQLEKYYHDKEVDRTKYQQFMNRELIRTLIQLNGRARVRYYGTEEILRKDDADLVTSIFAVTYLEDETSLKTFFVRLVVERTDRADKTTGFWKVVRYQGGVRPRL